MARLLLVRSRKALEIYGITLGSSAEVSPADRAQSGKARKWIIPPTPPAYRLEDRYLKRSGRVFMTGTQALVRIVLDQARRDREAGLRTAGFVSGYRGSPLGGVDMELWRCKKWLDEAGVEFLPAVNEDLAATAVLGSQQVETHPDRKVEGVFGLWYGKGPGVDRAGDALKHGNAYGSSPHGGVLVVAGDDHGCVSSSMPHQSDVAFMAWFMPTLNPASVAEYLAFGEYGYALSRYSGMWIGMKAISETVESAASFELPPPRAFLDPGFVAPPDGLHYRWLDLPGPHIEVRMEAKKDAALAFATANPIDRRIYDVRDATYGIVTTGKAHLDLMEALRLLGLDEAACRKIGLDVYKVGMVWPLAPRGALEFVRGKREILIVEEKRGIIESQFKEYFYDYPGDKPHCMVGKRDEQGEPLIPWIGETSPRLLAPILARRLDAVFPGPRHQRPRGGAGARPRAADRGSRRDPHAVFLLGLPAQHFDQSAGGLQGDGGDRLPCHGDLDGPRDLVADPDGRRRRQLGRLVQIHRQPAHLPEPRRGHLLPFGLDGDPSGDRCEDQHHLQDPLQRRRRDDRRPARRRPDQRGGDRARGARRRRRAHRAGLGRSRQILAGRFSRRRHIARSQPTRRRAARNCARFPAFPC